MFISKEGLSYPSVNLLNGGYVMKCTPWIVLSPSTSKNSWTENWNLDKNTNNKSSPVLFPQSWMWQSHAFCFKYLTHCLENKNVGGYSLNSVKHALDHQWKCRLLIGRLMAGQLFWRFAVDFQIRDGHDTAKPCKQQVHIN